MKKYLWKVLIFTALALLVMPVLAACSSGPTNVDVKLNQDYSIDLSQDSAPAGEIVFHITNTATDLEHEFVIVKTDKAANNLPLEEPAETDVDENQINIVTEQEAIQPGDSDELTVTLEPGHYALICNLAGHYMQGMHTDFTVN